MIHFNCTACNKSLKVKDELAGRKRICPPCQQPVTIPAMAVSPSGNEAVAEAPTLAPAARFLSQEAGQSGARQETVTYRPGAPQLQTIAPDAAPAGCDPAHYDFLAPPEEPDELGRLGAYRVLKVLGAGGMGVVFLVEDATLKRKVALKAMLPTLAASESARQRFLREAQAAAAIEHDNIVAIFQVGEDRGVPFITMPFLKGEPLEARLQREPVLPIDEVIRIGRETARGLAAAHAADLMHRDIKPANLWLEGTEGRVKILDFGLARAGADDARLTQVGVIVGTPAYMAPEQANAQAIDVRCDLFSLGSVLYRLSTGNLPFKGPDTISTLMAVATVEPPPPRKLNPSLPQGLSDLILKLLSKKPGDRLPSAEAVIQALDDVEISLRPKGEGKANASVSPSPEGQEKGSEAEAHHQAYLAALEKPDWARALQELVKTIKLDAKRFAPFPTSKYSLQRILGKDDLGVTFLCKHKSMDAQVVVKGLISAEMGQQSDKVFAEAQALRQLDHPTILRMADCGYVDPATKSRPFLVMDHFNGATLEEHVQKNGPLPFADALAVARQVADGLHAAHDKKILHRSVNPSSLLIRKEGAAWRVKLIDFGLAPRPKSTGRGAKTLPRDCAAPELIGTRDSALIGSATDVYGWARTCCYALFQTAQPLLSHWHSLPAPVAQLFERCLADDPKKRPQSFAEVFGLLDTFAAAEKLEAYALALHEKTPKTAPTRGETARASQRPRTSHKGSWATSPMVLGAGAMLFAVLITGLVGILVWRARTKPGTLMVEIDTPGAEIYLDGAPYTTTATDDREPIQLKVPVGARQLKVVKPGFEPFTRDFTVKPGAAESVQVRLVPQKAAVASAKEDSPKGKVPSAGSVAPPPLPSTLDQLNPEKIPVPDRNPKLKGLVGVLKGHTGLVWSVAFSPDGKALASAGEDGTVRLWDLTGSEPRASAVKNGHTGSVICVAFSPNGRTLASGSSDKTARLWDLQEPAQEPVVLRGYASAVSRLAFAPDGLTLATGSWNQIGTLTFWDLTQTTPRKKDVVTSHEGVIVGLAYAPDGRTLASSGLGAQPIVLLWDVTGVAPKQRASLQHPPAWIYPVVFTPDSSTLATGSHDGKVRLWDLAGKEPTVRATLPWGNSKEGSMAYAPHGRTLVTGNGDGRITLWNPTSLLKLQEWQLPGQAWVVFAADGRHLAASCANGAIYILRLTPEESPIPGKPPAERWTALFNGKDLTGWKVAPAGNGIWKVSNGAVVGAGSSGSLLSMRSDFTNFHLRAEVAINEGGNSGISFRMPPDWKGQGYEAVICSSSLKSPWRTGSLLYQGKPALEARTPVGKAGVAGKWFTYEVIAEGKDVTLTLGGYTSKKIAAQPLAGPLALKLHSLGTIVQFRKIEIRETK